MPVEHDRTDLHPFRNVVLRLEPPNTVRNLAHRPTEQRFRGTFAMILDRWRLVPSREQLESKRCQLREIRLSHPLNALSRWGILVHPTGVIKRQSPPRPVA